MELLHKVVTDFVLFSFIEGCVFCACFKYYGNCRGFGFKEVVTISLVNCIVSQIIPPILYQVVMIVWMGCYLFLFKNKTILVGLYLSFVTMILMLVVEMIIAIFYEKVLHLNFMGFDRLSLFFTILPMKIVEILLIIGGSRMKAWYGTIEKRK